MTHRSRTGGPSKNHKKGASAAGTRQRKLHHPPPLPTDAIEPSPPTTLSCPPQYLDYPSDQQILDLIYAALRSTLASPDFIPTVQRIKGLLYDAQWLAVFTDPTLLEAYAGRWVPSRALCFRELFGCVPEIVGSLKSGGHVLSLGGGAGSELVALGAVVRALKDEARNGIQGDEEESAGAGVDDEDRDDEDDDEFEEGGEIEKGEAVRRTAETDERTPPPDSNGAVPSPSTSASTDIQWTGADIGAWTRVLDLLGDAVENTWSIDLHRKYYETDLLDLTTLTSDTSSLTQSLESVHIDTPPTNAQNKHDSPTKAESSPPQPTPTLYTHLSASPPTLITLLFTLTELLSQSPQRTISFLTHLTTFIPRGSLFLVADSASDIASFSLGGSREWPTYTIMDMVLLRMMSGQWEMVREGDSRWWRLPTGVGGGWPVKLENARYWYRLYRRV